jgi:hypothetical protein
MKILLLVPGWIIITEMSHTGSEEHRDNDHAIHHLQYYVVQE